MEDFVSIYDFSLMEIGDFKFSNFPICFIYKFKFEFWANFYLDLGIGEEILNWKRMSKNFLASTSKKKKEEKLDSTSALTTFREIIFHFIFACRKLKWFGRVSFPLYIWGKELIFRRCRMGRNSWTFSAHPPEPVSQWRSFPPTILFFHSVLNPFPLVRFL